MPSRSGAALRPATFPLLGLLFALGACRGSEGGLHVIIDGPFAPVADFDELVLRVTRADGGALSEESLRGAQLGPLPVSFNFLSGPSTPPGTRVELTCQVARG